MATTMTYEQWTAEGRERFGEDMLRWRFVCPACGHEQCAEDFRKFAAVGATSASAYTECIGRYLGAGWRPLDCGPCDYAGYGLFRLSPVTVLIEGEEVQAFAFAKV